MKLVVILLMCSVALTTAAIAQTPAVDPSLDLSRVPPQALARMQPDLRAAEASSQNFLPAEAPPFTTSGPIQAGQPIFIVPRRHAHAAILDTPLVKNESNGVANVLLEPGSPLFRWHVPAADASKVLAYWCGVKDEHAFCFDDNAVYIANSPVPFAPGSITQVAAFDGGRPRPRSTM